MSPEPAPEAVVAAAPAAQTLLELREVHLSYDAVPALRGVSVEVAEGELVVLLGANGAGKTSTLRAISRLSRISAGEISFRGQRIHRWTPAKVARSGIAQVPEGRHVFPDHTVRENLELGGFQLRRNRAAFAEALADVFTLFPRLAERSHQLAGTLSGGEAQMLAVGRALMSRPDLLMLDEPSLGLAPQLVAEMFGYLRRLSRDHGLTILLVEQQARLALQIADRGYVLQNGRVVISGSAEELRDDPQVRRVYLGG